MDITQWGDIYTFKNQQAFSGCQNMDITAADSPKLSGTTAQLFKYCDNLVGTASFTNWDLTSVTAVNGMFLGAKKFNQSLAGWNLKNITNVNGMFDGAVALTCLNFSLTLRGWANNPETPNTLVLGNLPAGLTFGDQAAYDKLTVDKGWTINGVTYDGTCAGSLPLPVTFTDLTASISNGEMLVKWKTVSEHNNDKFIIYASNDGKNWTDVGTVKTKAANGNSSEVLEYEHTVMMSDLKKAGIPVVIALMLASGLLFNHRKHLFFCIALLTGVFFAGCNKNDLTLEEIMSGDVYVKVTQIDKDGKTTSDSNVIYVKKEK
ncbi:BspA family leucine-rich repeat surface protein [Pedobacter sp. BS3]|uniref:BspA family leucine-rich repeat surface protein n=1 Tax=Pedobacter sp. BS3 TaxID=2567937 RepID=UPI0011EBB738|nr:BspA family leucine-rich repeat surface protein [Pedobacter sp. BS3]TZF84665.1 BspA family leucine-rich repeat surface protein [Pedobacter sp. BS3]